MPVPRIPVDLVIFDCDGVLVDSEPLSNAVLAGALTRAGLQTTPEQAVATYKGLHIPTCWSTPSRRSAPHCPPTSSPASRTRAPRPSNANSWRSTGPPRRWPRSARPGIAVCVASQGKRSKTELTLGLTGLRSLFGEDAVFSAHSVKRGKPHPDLFLHAARAMGATPDRTMVIEDTVVGVTAAVAAGMRAIGYGADSDPDALRAAGADVIEDLSELPARLGLGGSQRDRG